MNIRPIQLTNKSIFTQLFSQSKDQYWLPNSVSLATDKTQWPTIDLETRRAVLSLLKYAILLDSYQVTNISDFCAQVNQPELKALLSFHAMMEAVHSESYAYFAETVCSAEEKKYLYQIDNEGAERLNYLEEIIGEYGKIAANYWLEAVAFQGLFRLADILRSKSLLPGLSTLIQLIARDEELHVKTFEVISTADDTQWIYEALTEFAPKEGIALANSTGILDFKVYIPFIAAYRLKSLGFKTPEVRAIIEKGNPFKDIYHYGDYTKAKLKGNFFTNNLVYDTDLSELDWEVNNWFQTSLPTHNNTCASK
jgi:ribonucleotide reductase beta subunit family protein with ferritin-like domain